jgi:putative flippase GtrA
MNIALNQVARYLVVGLISNGLLYLAYLGLTFYGLGPKVAMTLLYGLGVLQTFVFNKKWSFNHEGSIKPAFSRYVAAYGCGYLINYTALFILVDNLGMNHQIIQAIMIIIVACVLFLLLKFWVFRTKSE